MVMRYAWALPLVLAVAAAAWWFGWRMRKQGGVRRWVANSSYLTSLPAYRSAMAAHRAWSACFVAVLAGCAVVAGVMASGPQHAELSTDDTPPTGTKDIVICLDVSFSMDYYNVQIVDSLLSIVNALNGERVGMSMFNSTSTTVFPLTDDYDLVKEELTYAKKMLTGDFMWGNEEEMSEWQSFYDPTIALPDQASLIPDGLAACTELFDSAKTERSRTIIMATDNQINGTPIFTLDEATDLVKQKGAILDAMYAHPIDWTPNEANEEAELKAAAESTGGRFVQADDTGAIEEIVKDIASQQIAHRDKPPELVYSDRNVGVAVAALLGALALVVVGWRVRL